MGDDKKVSKHQPEEIVKTNIAYLWSLLVAMSGGLVLLWWEYEYHPTNRQLWMVPFGLVLFVTPIIAWFADIVSETCDPQKEDSDTKKCQLAVCVNHPTDNV